ncbi:MAG: hypothetical protein A3H59_02915 [Candidatus Jacksonbacteria bacterium RIFCSPLOWO2_02_FULL_43_9]|nr:MAG: Trifunctional protein RibF/MnmA [Parcubacteria group bacterium GW2011_GWA2_43_13]OGY69371.1 MAG: hypothetical protein A3B94_03605 [Candidatus Jacksonbacteria bacterium RIFCSPHIGHO2_02_FULL_43_10]OGY70572.1 MAG: hypothetical protein A2986_02585 [Candidatus Jacksonbacteria bacterium RIFCSPLOWO2_01_FULL_44_13]OGY74152.1 MAG: hypothetical protein A3H59_02915 [Candidatus Jacksonbacteria bacterium RIFCSPLOWO2_02_FULL_43_9]HAZ16349.1 hypothetical protein [Candidatus Jacksonbacteria bacterium]
MYKVLAKIKGEVVRGAGRGKHLGIPTMNIQYQDIPNIQHGIYVCRICIDDVWRGAVMHFGPVLMFEPDTVTCEVHVFDFDQNVVGKDVEVEVVSYIRPIKMFDSIRLLIDAIENDCRVARLYFQTKQ